MGERPSSKRARTKDRAWGFGVCRRPSVHASIADRIAGFTGPSPGQRGLRPRQHGDDAHRISNPVSRRRPFHGHRPALLDHEGTDINPVLAEPRARCNSCPPGRGRCPPARRVLSSAASLLGHSRFRHDLPPQRRSSTASRAAAACNAVRRPRHDRHGRNYFQHHSGSDSGLEWVPILGPCGNEYRTSRRRCAGNLAVHGMDPDPARMAVRSQADGGVRRRHHCKQHRCVFCL